MDISAACKGDAATRAHSWASLNLCAYPECAPVHENDWDASGVGEGGHAICLAPLARRDTGR